MESHVVKVIDVSSYHLCMDSCAHLVEAGFGILAGTLLFRTRAVASTLVVLENVGDRIFRDLEKQAFLSLQEVEIGGRKEKDL